MKTKTVVKFLQHLKKCFIDGIVFQWSKEAKAMCRDKPLILVGCKSDTRNDKSLNTEVTKCRRTLLTYKQVNKN